MRQAGGFEQHNLAGERDAALDLADQAAQRGGFVGFVEIAQAGLLAEEVRQLIDGKAAGNQPDAAGLALRVFDGRLLFVLVAGCSPTISSSRSSMVTRPATPPYSSMTMRMCCFSRCISRSSS